MSKWKLSVKYDPSQPRVPAGSAGGGRWAGGGIPADAVPFSGTLYHATSPAAAESIQKEGFRFPEEARQRDAVYFGRKPLSAGLQSGAVVEVNISKANLAPTSSRFMEISNEIRESARAAIRKAPREQRWDLRDKFNDDWVFSAARKRFTAEGYDGYEQGWEVVAITNMELLNDALFKNKGVES